jgi:hypothetical protein
MAPFLFMQSSQEIIEFYWKQIQEHVNNALGRVCGANGILLNPTSPAQLVPIPVYEGEVSLLSNVNTPRRQTRISWPVVSEPDYLQAYVKKYRTPPEGRLCSEVVVNVSNYCWARYYAAKELMHVMIDEDGYAATNTFEHVNDLIESLAEGGFTVVEEAGPQTIVDEIAWLGASLYMIPVSWEPAIAKLHRDMSEKLPDVNPYLHIAQILRVPERVLRSRLRHPIKTTGS